MKKNGAVNYLTYGTVEKIRLLNMYEVLCKNSKNLAIFVFLCSLLQTKVNQIMNSSFSV